MQQFEVGDLLVYVGTDNRLRGRKYRVANIDIDNYNHFTYYTIIEKRSDLRTGIAIQCSHSFAVFNFFKVGKQPTLMETE